MKAAKKKMAENELEEMLALLSRSTRLAVLTGSGISAESGREPDRRPVNRRRELSLDDHVAGVLAGDRTVLGRTITLVESNSLRHEALAQDVLRWVLVASIIVVTVFKFLF